MHIFVQIYETKVIRLFGNITLHNVVKKVSRIYGGKNEYCVLSAYSGPDLFTPSL